ncbi:MAG: hypothetical protein ACOCU4_08065 [Alkalispirochaeta sp.]
MTLDFFRRPLAIPFPRSLSTALRAYRHGQIGIEAAVYRAGSVDSVRQRPLNIPLVQELLAKSGLDIRINRPVGQELFENLEHPDREIADFAAQTLSRLEERYYRELQRLEQLEPPEQLNQQPRRTWLDQLSRRYMDFAALQRFNRTMERYYLRKCVQMLEGDPYLPDNLYLRRVRAQVRMGELEAAQQQLDNRRFRADEAIRRERLLLEAEIAYLRRDLTRVQELLATLRAYEDAAQESAAAATHRPSATRRRAIPYEVWL